MVARIANSPRLAVEQGVIAIGDDMAEWNPPEESMRTCGARPGSGALFRLERGRLRLQPFPHAFHRRCEALPGNRLEQIVQRREIERFTAYSS